MAEWVVCPGCNLKHSPRPDGRCPRCRAPVAPAAAAGQPGEARAPAPSELAEPTATAAEAPRRLAITALVGFAVAAAVVIAAVLVVAVARRQGSAPAARAPTAPPPVVERARVLPPATEVDLTPDRPPLRVMTGMGNSVRFEAPSHWELVSEMRFPGARWVQVMQLAIQWRAKGALMGVSVNEPPVLKVKTFADEIDALHAWIVTSMTLTEHEVVERTRIGDDIELARLRARRASPEVGDEERFEFVLGAVSLDRGGVIRLVGACPPAFGDALWEELPRIAIANRRSP